jgi:hypothetical protein
MTAAAAITAPSPYSARAVAIAAVVVVVTMAALHHREHLDDDHPLQNAGGTLPKGRLLRPKMT